MFKRLKFISIIAGLIVFTWGFGDKAIFFSKKIIQNSFLSDYISPEFWTSKTKTYQIKEPTKSLQTIEDIDEDGFLYLKQNGEKIYNPSDFIGRVLCNFYFLIYKDNSPEFKNISKNKISVLFLNVESMPKNMNLEDSSHPIKKYTDKINNLTNTKKFVGINGNFIEASFIEYNYEYTHNDQTLKPPFPSAYAQALYVRMLTLLYYTTPTEENRKKLINAISAYAIPLEKGGFTYKFNDNEFWFEEFPTQDPKHILNAHILSLVVLSDATKVLGINDFEYLIDGGRKALENRFSKDYDCGYFARYDLFTKNFDVYFKLSPYFDRQINPSASRHQLYIKRIIPRRLAGNPRETVNSILTTSKDAYIGASRIMGRWEKPHNIEEGNLGVAPVAQKFAPIPKDTFGLDTMSLFEIEFPREGYGDYALEIEYFDNEKGVVSLDMRDPHAGNFYKFDSIFVFQTQGDKSWKTILIPIKEKMLSGYIGPFYQYSHYVLLQLYNSYFKTNFFDSYLERYGIAIEKKIDSFFIPYPKIRLLESCFSKDELKISKNELENSKEIVITPPKPIYLQNLNFAAKNHGTYLESLDVSVADYQEKWRPLIQSTENQLKADNLYYKIDPFLPITSIRIKYTHKKNLIFDPLEKIEIHVSDAEINTKLLLNKIGLNKDFDKITIQDILILSENIGKIIKKNFSAEIEIDKQRFLQLKSQALSQLLNHLKWGVKIFSCRLPNAKLTTFIDVQKNKTDALIDLENDQIFKCNKSMLIFGLVKWDLKDLASPYYSFTERFTVGGDFTSLIKPNKEIPFINFSQEQLDRLNQIKNVTEIRELPQKDFSISIKDLL
jgi:hypothetical protein